MKHLAAIAIIISFVSLLVSCKDQSSKRNVSEIPIKTEILGLKLCEQTNEKAIKKAISEATGESVRTETRKNSVGSTIRVYPTQWLSSFNYGGFSWHYVDVELNEDNKVFRISVQGSYEKYENAKDQYDAVLNVFSKKYGKGNENEKSDQDFENIIWTDDTNTVGLTCHQSIAVNGQERSFCYLYYVNIKLATAFEQAIMQEI